MCHERYVYHLQVEMCILVYNMANIKDGTRYGVACYADVDKMYIIEEHVVK